MSFRGCYRTFRACYWDRNSTIIWKSTNCVNSI